MKLPSHSPFSLRTAVAIGMVICLGSFFALMSQSKKEAPNTYPQVVMIIRHGEKPPDSDASPHLSEAGMKRANALSKLFESEGKKPAPFPKPDLLFAAKPSGKSQRSTETLEPLAKRWNLTVNADFDKDDGEKLARWIFHEPKCAGKTILIAWNHSAIPNLARALKATNAPIDWKDSHFDRVWVIRYSGKGTAEFQDQPQLLMPGDKAK